MKVRAFSLSIKQKLTLLMVAVSAVVLSASTLLLYQYQLESVEQSAIESSQMQAALVAASIESAVIFQDDKATQRILDLLVTNTSVEYASVVTASGLIYADYHKDSGLQQSPHHQPGVIPNTGQYIKDNHLDVTAQVTDRGNIIAHVLMCSNLKKVTSQQLYYKKIALSVMGLSMLLAYFLAQVFQKIITNPLSTMVQHVTNISCGEDYSKRLPCDSRDELGTLARGFNQMITVVQAREDDLTKHNNNLQSIVDKRTQQLYHKAHFDALTNLPNRYLLLDRLSNAIVSAQSQQTKLAVLFLDLDRFKIINDSLGHDVGDELLQAVAQRLLSVGRSKDIVARLGGDEFVYLLSDLESAEDSAQIAKKVTQLFAQPFNLKNHLLHISTSLGISVYPDDGNDGQVLLRNADLSMYHAKEQGLGEYCFYTQAMNTAISKRLEIEHKLRNAIKYNEFKLLYQPQINLKSNQIEQVEALLRWHNPVLGPVEPSVFVPIAEEIGIIKLVGEWVIEQVCRQLHYWQQSHDTKLLVAINLSSSHLLDVNIVDYVKAMVAKYQLSATQLEIEITEDVFLEHSQQTIATLERLRALGLKIAIDDFGTGYSSLRYLNNLPVDTLKLDGMFVRDLEHNASSRGIVTSTITLAHSLNMNIVAEGVERKEQLDFLIANHCDLIQGFYFYNPLTADEISNLTTKENDEKLAIICD